MKAINISVRPCNQEILFTFMPLHGGVLVSCRSFRHEFGPCNPPIRCFSDAFVDGFTKKNTSHDVFEKQKRKTINLRIMTLWAHDISSAFSLNIVCSQKSTS